MYTILSNAKRDPIYNAEDIIWTLQKIQNSTVTENGADHRLDAFSPSLKDHEYKTQNT